MFSALLVWTFHDRKLTMTGDWQGKIEHCEVLHRFESVEFH